MVSLSAYNDPEREYFVQNGVLHRRTIRFHVEKRFADKDYHNPLLGQVERLLSERKEFDTWWLWHCPEGCGKASALAYLGDNTEVLKQIKQQAATDFQFAIQVEGLGIITGNKEYDEKRQDVESEFVNKYLPACICTPGYSCDWCEPIDSHYRGKVRHIDLLDSLPHEPQSCYDCKEYPEPPKREKKHE
jgi:hypothetical protein